MSRLHDRSKRLFVEALALTADERPEFLARACGDDEPLRDEVESLLAHHEEARLEELDAEAADVLDRRATGLRRTLREVVRSWVRREPATGRAEEPLRPAPPPAPPPEADA